MMRWDEYNGMVWDWMMYKRWYELIGVIALFVTLLKKNLSFPTIMKQCWWTKEPRGDWEDVCETIGAKRESREEEYLQVVFFQKNRKRGIKKGSISITPQILEKIPLWVYFRKKKLLNLFFKELPLKAYSIKQKIFCLGLFLKSWILRT